MSDEQKDLTERAPAELQEDVKYPDVTVRLTGQDGNAFGILGRVGTAMRRAGIPAEEIDEFRREAMSGDYDHVLQTVMATVNVE